MNHIDKLIKNTNEVYQPTILRLSNSADRELYNSLIATGALFVSDEIKGQLTELVKSRSPSVNIPPEQYDPAIEKHLNGTAINDYGVWVYYPWSKRLVHLLDEAQFIEVRTNRNQYKITQAERDKLATKKVGIIGLSVGQSIALTIAMERGCGELRLADFDTLELSNLNRIRTGVHNLGLPKVVIAAREIAEIDPFIKVKCFFDGLTQQNMDDFFCEGDKIDILVDECDGLDIKILARYKARELGIPVIMDTSDRGMLDIERFDLEPERPILHGMVAGLHPGNIKDISNEDKVPLVLQMLGVDNISVRAKASMIEVRQSINTWPQLASSVTLGGASGADTCRRILLDQLHVSGRFYIDFDDLIREDEEQKPHDQRPSLTNNTNPSVSVSVPVPTRSVNPFSPLLAADMVKLAEKVSIEPQPRDIAVSAEQAEALVAAANAAPSTGNDQPWKWLYQNGTLYLFHDQYRSFSFSNFRSTASYISFGAAYENLYIHALSMGVLPHCKLADAKLQPVVATIRFSLLEEAASKETLWLAPLDKYIYQRVTNRHQHPKTPVLSEHYARLTTVGESVLGANVRFFTDPPTIQALGEIIGFCDRVRLLNVDGHFDFAHREMRWSQEEAEKTRDGIGIHTLGLNKPQMAVLNVMKSAAVTQTLNTLNGAKVLEAFTQYTASTASALCLITFSGPGQRLDRYFEGGRAMERLWLAATELDLAIHPLTSPLSLFSRLVQGAGEGIEGKYITELEIMRKRFCEITGVNDATAEVFLAKITVAQTPALKSFRLQLEETLFLV